MHSKIYYVVLGDFVGICEYLVCGHHLPIFFGG